MRKLIITTCIVFLGTILNSQNRMFVHTSGLTEEYLISDTDSMYFSSDANIMYLNVSGNIMEYWVNEVDSITFDITLDNTVYVLYEEESVSIINPLSGAGVEITVDGADVVVNSTSVIDDINFVLSGVTEDGMFKIYSEAPFNLLLNGVDLTNPDGPPINIQSNETSTINLVAGTSNTLTDGPDYSQNEEDQSGTFFSEGDLIFIGSGSMTINGFGSEQHGLRSDDGIQINEGNILIASSVKDGIHGKNGFTMNGGIIEIYSSGDGIDGSEGNLAINNGNITINSSEADVKGIKCDNTITMNGGMIDMTLSGNQSKGIKCDQDMMLNGGTITIDATGGVVLEASGLGYDPSYCTAIKGESDIYIDGCTLNITSSGPAGRGISCDASIFVEDGEINITCSGDGAKYTNTAGEDDAYHGCCINADVNMIVRQGNLTLSNSGAGGKGISVDNRFTYGGSFWEPFLDVETTGESIVITPGNNGKSDEAKAIKADVSVIINSGQITIYSADDGIKSEDTLTVNNGIINITHSYEGLEGPNITINNGELYIYASDDAINATYGLGGELNDGSLLLINGGYIMLSSTSGDALDSNGDITVNGGTTVVHGPQSSPEVGMDVNGQCRINDGFIVISGTNSFMTQGPSNNSTQYSLLVRTNSSIPANSIFHIEDSQGNDIVTFSPFRQYYSIIFSSSALESGETYKIYTGGSCSGSVLNGLYTGGVYSGGTFRKNFTITGMVTNVNF